MLVKCSARFRTRGYLRIRPELNPRPPNLEIASDPRRDFLLLRFVAQKSNCPGKYKLKKNISLGHL